MKFAEIGRRRPRVDGKQQVTGEVRYTADLHFPGMLCANGHRAGCAVRVLVANCGQRGGCSTEDQLCS